MASNKTWRNTSIVGRIRDAASQYNEKRDAAARAHWKSLSRGGKVGRVVGTVAGTMAGALPAIGSFNRVMHHHAMAVKMARGAQAASGRSGVSHDDVKDYVSAAHGHINRMKAHARFLNNPIPHTVFGIAGPLIGAKIGEKLGTAVGHIPGAVSRAAKTAWAHKGKIVGGAALATAASVAGKALWRSRKSGASTSSKRGLLGESAMARVGRFVKRAAHTALDVAAHPDWQLGSLVAGAANPGSRISRVMGHVANVNSVAGGVKQTAMSYRKLKKTQPRISTVNRLGRAAIGGAIVAGIAKIRHGGMLQLGGQARAAKKAMFGESAAPVIYAVGLREGLMAAAGNAVRAVGRKIKGVAYDALHTATKKTVPGNVHARLAKTGANERAGNAGAYRDGASRGRAVGGMRNQESFREGILGTMMSMGAHGWAGLAQGAARRMGMKANLSGNRTAGGVMHKVASAIGAGRTLHNVGSSAATAVSSYKKNRAAGKGRLNSAARAGVKGAANFVGHDLTGGSNYKIGFNAAGRM